jgi:hypothetical protein
MNNKTARQDLETVIRVEDLALGSMRKLRGIQDWLRSQASDTAPMPENKDHARAMAIIGMKWLQDNSPGELVHVVAIEPVITNEMKAEFMGEFEFTIEAECGECIDTGEDEDCEVCQGGIVYERKVTVPWTTCKRIYKAMARFDSSRAAHPPIPTQGVPEEAIGRLEHLLEGIENVRRNVGGDGYLWGYTNAMHKELKEVIGQLSSTPGNGWVTCEDRLPTEKDADFSGNVIWWENPFVDLREDGWKPIVANWNPEEWDGCFFSHIGEIIKNHPYWMPTDLKLPNPPTMQEGG